MKRERRRQICLWRLSLVQINKGYAYKPPSFPCADKGVFRRAAFTFMSCKRDWRDVFVVSLAVFYRQNTNYRWTGFLIFFPSRFSSLMSILGRVEGGAFVQDQGVKRSTCFYVLKDYYVAYLKQEGKGNGLYWVVILKRLSVE